MKSVVLIVPDQLLERANAWAGALGWGNPSFTVPLVTNETVTHWGLHAWSDLQLVDALMAEVSPAALEQFADVKAGLISSVRDSADNHWLEVLAAHGLAMVQDDE